MLLLDSADAAVALKTLVLPEPRAKYYFRVTAVDRAMNESGFSNETSNSVEMSLPLLAQWNMLALPVAVDDPRAGFLFAGAGSPAYEYISSSYNTTDTLRPARGYWLKFGQLQSHTFIGVPIFDDTVEVTDRWNLIGGISRSIPVAGIGSIPPGMVVSDFYAYDTLQGYVRSDSLIPGRGYWVRVSNPGKLLLSVTRPPQCLISIISTTEPPPPPPSGQVSDGGVIPAEFMLYQNSPNPFNPSCAITFDLPKEEEVTLSVYGLLGQMVRTLLEGAALRAGRHSVRFDGLELPSGIYFYRLKAGTFISTRKMVLVR